jgi:hypothetical protein
VKEVGKHSEKGVGKFDFCVKNDEKVTIICEAFASHNLLLPMTASDCAAKYIAAFVDVYGLNKSNRSLTRKQTDEMREAFPIEWSTIAHPLGQLIAYMVDYKKYYGALTSGTRTYFISVNNIDTTECQVYISDAWFVGQKNNLRAWAYVHQLGGSDKDDWVSPPLTWIRSSTKVNTPKAFRENYHYKFSSKKENSTSDTVNDTLHVEFSSTGCTSTGGQMESLYDMLPQVPFDDIEILDELGTVRNGSCLKVKWNGEEYAMKQFDIGWHGDQQYCHEIEAYAILKEAWGDLVPCPLFLSESFSGGILFLGLQLGRKPTEQDKNFDLNVKEITQRLEMEYGIYHNDVEDRNMVVISDENGCDKLVAIDFEDWEDYRLENELMRRSHE